MPTYVKLKSRLPAIAVELDPRADEALHAAGEAIANDAQARASSIYQGETPFDIHTGSNDRGFGVMANWYWFFGEFGTSKQAARSFMIPAAEANKDSLVEAVRAAMEGL